MKIKTQTEHDQSASYPDNSAHRRNVKAKEHTPHRGNHRHKVGVVNLGELHDAGLIPNENANISFANQHLYRVVASKETIATARDFYTHGIHPCQAISTYSTSSGESWYDPTEGGCDPHQYCVAALDPAAILVQERVQERRASLETSFAV